MTVLYAGTVGQGVWRSLDEGETFARVSNGMFMEAEVRALALHPQNPQLLYAGTDAGLYRTENGGDHWERLETPFDSGKGWQAGMLIWSLLLHPQNPETILVGTCPPALYRSQDSGKSWEKLSAMIEQDCPPIRYNRVTCLVADPVDENTLWAGVEIDGVYRSRDNGESWERLGTGLSSQDIHGLAIVPGSPKTLLATTNNDVNLSTDDGETWQPQQVREVFPNAYCRGILAKSDAPNTLFLGNGNGPPGTIGSLQVSHDGGKTWKMAELPTVPNSTLWTFTTNPALPNTLFAASINGEIYRSQDGGASWSKCQHEFGEVRALVLSHS